jgi:hypothetical protein
MCVHSRIVSVDLRSSNTNGCPAQHHLRILRIACVVQANFFKKTICVSSVFFCCEMGQAQSIEEVDASLPSVESDPTAEGIKVLISS